MQFTERVLSMEASMLHIGISSSEIPLIKIRALYTERTSVIQGIDFETDSSSLVACGNCNAQRRTPSLILLVFTDDLFAAQTEHARHHVPS